MKRTNALAEEEFLGIYLKQISRYRPVKSTEETALARDIRQGSRRALHTLVKANLRFVVSVAMNYRNQGLLLGDLINEGNMGLIKAAQRFDETKNFKFISYAVWWIRQAILQALADQSRIVKIPANKAGVLHKIGKTEERLEQRLQREPDLREIAEALNTKERKLEVSQRVGNRHVSLDSPIGGGEDASLVELLRDDNSDTPEEWQETKSARRYLRERLDMLGPRERKVLSLCFGLDDGVSRTLDEAGATMNITRERVRQIRETALRRLRGLTTRQWFATEYSSLEAPESKAAQGANLPTALS